MNTDELCDYITNNARPFGFQFSPFITDGVYKPPTPEEKFAQAKKEYENYQKHNEILTSIKARDLSLANLQYISYFIIHPESRDYSIHNYLDVFTYTHTGISIPSSEQVLKEAQARAEKIRLYEEAKEEIKKLIEIQKA